MAGEIVIPKFEVSITTPSNKEASADVALDKNGKKALSGVVTPGENYAKADPKQEYTKPTLRASLHGTSPLKAESAVAKNESKTYGEMTLICDLGTVECNLETAGIGVAAAEGDAVTEVEEISVEAMKEQFTITQFVDRMADAGNESLDALADLEDSEDEIV